LPTRVEATVLITVKCQREELLSKICSTDNLLTVEIGDEIIISLLRILLRIFTVSLEALLSVAALLGVPHSIFLLHPSQNLVIYVRKGDWSVYVLLLGRPDVYGIQKGFV